MDLFWRRGFDGAGVSDMTAATGLSASSLYNVHGSKQEWLAASIELYLDVLMEHMLGPMRDGDAGLEDVRAFVDRLETTGVMGDGRGCLAVRCIQELDSPSPAVQRQLDRYLANLRDAIAAALRRAKKAGEIDAAGALALQPQLEAFAISFNLLAGSGADPALCTAHADTMRAALPTPLAARQEVRK